MKTKRTITILTLVVAIAAMASFGVFRNIQKVKAFNPQPDPPGYGMVGITDGQTISTVEVFANASGRTQFLVLALSAVRVPPPVPD